MLARNAGRIIGVGDGKDYQTESGQWKYWGGGGGAGHLVVHLPKILVKQNAISGMHSDPRSNTTFILGVGEASISVPNRHLPQNLPLRRSINMCRKKKY